MKEQDNDKMRSRFNHRMTYHQQDKASGIDVQNAIDFIQRVKTLYSESSPIFLKFLEAMKDFRLSKLTGSDLYAVISRLFADKPNIVQEFKSFIPQNAVIPEENKILEKMHKPINNTYEFVNTKSKIKEKDLINKFIELLVSFKRKPINPQKVNDLHSMINEYPDLVNKLTKLNVEEKEEPITPFDVIKQKLKNFGVYKEFMKCINSYNQNLISKNDLIFLVRQLIKEEKLISEFIKYLSPNKIFEKEKKNYLATVGSYRIIKNGPSDSIINDYCVGCPTHNREDENYVFLKRNIYEENLFRIEDERFEIDLLILRFELFIISLEKILLTDYEEIGISQLEISSGIVQSILELVYKENYSEILEGILSKPKQTIPIVLGRLYKVNEKIKKEKVEKEKTWEEVTKMNYYKALDNIYFDFKSSDKKNLMYKHMSVNYVDKEICLKDLNKVEEKIKYFIRIFFDGKEEIIKLIDNLFNILNENNISFCINNLYFSVFCYLIILYERIFEVYSWNLEELNFSKLSRGLGLIDRMDIKDRKTEIFNTIEYFLEKKIDSSTFEEEIRVLSKNNGYKLFNIDKIMNKLENKCMLILNDKESCLLLEEILNNKSELSKEEIEEGEIIKSTEIDSIKENGLSKEAENIIEEELMKDNENNTKNNKTESEGEDDLLVKSTKK